MNLILEFIKFIIFSLGIVTISKYMLVPVLRKISVALKLSPKASGNIAGFATSVPEFLTVSFSAASGLIGTSVYNILSSNIINLIQYIFAIYLNKNQKFLRNRAILIDIFLVIATIIIPLVLAIFNVTLGITSVVIFLILLVVFYYINHNVHKIYLEKEDEKIKKEELEEEIEEEKKIKRNNLIFYWIALLIIAWLLYFVGELLSNSLTNLCNTFGLPELVLGILLGFITSIPELITFIEAQRKEKKFEPVPDYTVCDICVGQDECYLEESKKTFDSWTKEDYLRAVKVADYIKEAKLDAMIDIFEHPENFIVEGIGTIADILSGDIYEGVEYPLEIMAKLQQNCKTNFDGTRMQKSIELLEKTLQQNIEEVSKGNIQSVESLARQVVPEMEDVKDVDKTENRIERDILGKSQTEEKLK